MNEMILATRFLSDYLFPFIQLLLPPAFLVMDLATLAATETVVEEDVNNDSVKEDKKLLHWVIMELKELNQHTLVMETPLVAQLEEMITLPC